MKAKVIISEEYIANQPSVFLGCQGHGGITAYYGCLIYPKGRSYPALEYWETAMSSDEGRGFKVYDVEMGYDEYNRIHTLDGAVEYLNNLLKTYPKWEEAPTYKIKRGKKWEAYKEFREQEDAKIKAVSNYNKPFDNAIYAASTELRALILSLIK